MNQHRRARARRVTVLLSSLAATGIGVLASGAATLLTPDQAAYRDYQRQQYAAAADRFTDPMWRGVALYRQGEFKQAAGVFAGLDTAAANFNQGNALLMQGSYTEAAALYTRALEQNPRWDAAATNREIALGRAARLRQEGGEGTGGKLAADDYVFNTGGESPAAGEEQTDGGQATSDAENRALWLRQVQTRPADFLASKFAWQNAMREQLDNKATKAD